MSDPRPIGVFDSGIGGLTVVKALRDLLPGEKIFYLGDTARVPYGGKSASTVERYSLEIAEMLMEENAKTVVVACNTASSVALAKLEKHLPVPVIGVIRPGARAALATTRNGHVGVIGTRATIKSGAYERELRALNPQVRVSVCASPLLVPLIEEGWLDDELTDRVIARYLGPLVHQGIDTLVLGCTHYPLLVHAISRALPKTVSLVDSARNCAMAVKKLLVQSHLSAPAGNSAGLDIALTDAPDIFLSVARRALRLEIGNVQLREVLHSAPIAAR
ncbi:MAG: glutamate racemase [Verrucomicrobia bacterium]|nr:MAG: glutamate racemase [Verrucomicrobiota bacterium]PYK36315.1 MAG: glutamate racemase [Verrucomicrobiota bacterium]PYL21051.1 MAG: glutamate racemase [Verrucomicrobiota bacterium]